MATISSPGVGSNLDVSGIVSKLVSLERQPIQQLDLREAGYQAKISAIGSVKGALSSLQSAAALLGTASRFQGHTASFSDSETMSVSASSTASIGAYDIEVKQLAQAQKLASGTFTSVDTVVGTGTLTFRYGTTVDSPASFTANADKPIETVTIDTSNNTLAGLRTAINDANIGVTASIINDGSGYRLVLGSKDTGVANSLSISVEEGGLPAENTDTTGLSQLANDPLLAVGSGKNMTQTVAAQDAQLLINGLTVNSAKNTITTAIEGVTLNLLKAKDGTTSKLTVARDVGSVRSAIDGFIKAYNDAAKTLKDMTAYNATTKQAGPLLGDSAVMSLQSAVRGVLNGSLSTTNGYQSLSEVGISFQRDGTLTVDSTKLQAAIDDPDKDLSALFATAGAASDTTFSYALSTTSTLAGRYEVVITQPATQGVAVGGSAVASLDVTSSNDSLTLLVDGNAATISLTRKTYASFSELAAEVQARINGASPLTKAGASVTVSESGGVLTVTSSTFGASSKVSLTDGNALANLFGTPASTDGLDVAGTIGGQSATGAGQTLTSDSGSSIGLAINTKDASTGSLGWLEFTVGFGSQLNSALTGLIGSSGPLSSRLDGINANIKEIGKRRALINQRAIEAEKRFFKQYNALDSLLSQMQSTSQFLTQQLAVLAKL